MVRGMSSFYARCLTQSYSDEIQESPTLDLANDCFRFVTGYFEIISISSPHIYHSALVVAPKDSIVRRLYESHVRPLTRVVRGVPMSWDASTASAARPEGIWTIVWSPCDRLIAMIWRSPKAVDVLDSTTLQRLQTLEPPQEISTHFGNPIFSPDSRILTCSDNGHMDYTDLSKNRPNQLFVVNWDLQTGGIAGVTRLQVPMTNEIIELPRVMYLANGKAVGISFCYRRKRVCDVFIWDVVSGVLVHSHSFENTVLHSDYTWTHREALRFLAANVKTITIWEVGFTSGALPTKVQTIPTPGGFQKGVLLPTPCRLASIHLDRVQVWDTVIECSLNEYGSLNDCVAGPHNLRISPRYLDG